MSENVDEGRPEDDFDGIEPIICTEEELGRALQKVGQEHLSKGLGEIEKAAEYLGYKVSYERKPDNSMYRITLEEDEG